MPEPTDDLSFALALADTADAISLERFGALDLQVETKPDLTPVSDADRSVEQELRRLLTAERPDDAVLGEEFGAQQGGSGRRWIIDPIDGTKSYVRGVPIWATLIALYDGDEPLLGVVSAPALARRWWAARGEGAWHAALGSEPRQITVSKVAQLSDASVGYASLGGWREIGRYDQFLTLLGSVWRTRGYGDFWSYMMVAEGSIDIAAEPELSLWDMAALAPIVTEAGGSFTGVNGVPGSGQGNAVATNGLLHEVTIRTLMGRS